MEKIIKPLIEKQDPPWDESTIIKYFDLVEGDCQ
jgi:hypothetical protein